jgi:hypothetical protein
VVKGGNQDRVGAIGVSVAGVVSVDWLDGGSVGGNGAALRRRLPALPVTRV